MDLFNLVAKITLDDSAYKKGIATATEKGKSFGEKTKDGMKQAAKAITATVAAVSLLSAAFTKLITKTVDSIDTIYDNANALGMSTTAYQEWLLAVEAAGGSSNDLQTAVKSLTSVITGASEGAADDIIVLKELGLTYEDLADKTPEEQLALVVDAFRNLEDGTVKTKLATELFGSASTTLSTLLAEQDGSVNELLDSYKALGLVIDEDTIASTERYSKSIDELKARITVIKAEILEKLLPTLEATTGEIMRILSADKPWKQLSQDWADGMKMLLQPAIDKITEWKDVGLNWIKGIWEGFKSGVGWLTENIKSGMSDVVGSVKDFLGIASPSKLMAAEVGKYLPQGIAVGFENEMPIASQTMEKSLKTNFDPSALLNGFSSVLKVNSIGGESNYSPIVKVYIGDTELKTLAYDATNAGQKQRGLKDLKTTGGYAK